MNTRRWGSGLSVVAVMPAGQGVMHWPEGGASLVALSAEDAMLLLENEKFSAVVTDKNLPGKSGLDLLRYVREKHPGCACLIITGFVSTESVLEAMKLGASHYLQKPIDLAELRAVVEGRPADPSVAKFWDHFASTGRVAASAVGDGGIEILRTGKGGER